MSKKRIVIISIVAALVVAIVCVGAYVIQSPEYAMVKIALDIKELGVDGLRPHLTEDALEIFDAVSAVKENKLLGAIVGLLVKNDQTSLLESKIQEIQWDVKEVIKSSEQVRVILAFNYNDQLTGTTEISMIRETDGWKINDFELPKFDEINL